jgi:hypothetical protein
LKISGSAEARHVHDHADVAVIVVVDVDVVVDVHVDVVVSVDVHVIGSFVTRRR